jgi:purine-binding chemotaxis protein CheW
MSSQLVTFTLAGAHYGIDMGRVQEALRGPARTTIPLAGPAVAGFVNLRGQVVLTIDLRARLGIAAAAGDPEQMMVVVQVDGQPVGLLVDDVGDVVDVHERAPQAPPDTLPTSSRELLSGVYQLQDFLLLVLDLDRAIGAGTSLSVDTQRSTRSTP